MHTKSEWDELATLQKISQSGLVQLMKKFGYGMSDQGACYGISLILMQSILCGDLDAFLQRITMLYTTNPDELMQKISDATNKQIKINEAKSTKATEKPLSKDKKPLSKDEESLSEDEEFLLSMMPFLDGIAAIQLSKSMGLEKNTVLQNMSIIESMKLKKMGGMAKIDNFNLAGCYSKKELPIYFQGLASLLSNVNYPVVLNLQGSRHSIVVSYDPKNKKWLAGDPNQFPPKFLDEKDMVDYVDQSFNFDESHPQVLFTTDLYVANSKKTDLTQKYKTWLQKLTKDWKSIHALNDTRIGARDIFGKSYLHYVIRANDHSQVKELMKLKVNVNQYGQDNILPLYTAMALETDIAIAETLIECGAEIDAGNGSDFSTALMFAASNDRYDLVELLLKKGAVPDLVNKNVVSALYMALNCNYKISQILIDYGVDVNEVIGLEDNTVLMGAVANDRYDLVELFLSKGAKINAAAKDGATALIVGLVMQVDSKIVQLLLKQGADLNVYFEWRIVETIEPFLTSIKNLLKVLGKEKEEKIRYTPLVLAILKNDVTSIRLLLDYGADPTAECIKFSDGTSLTALKVAEYVEHTDKDIVSMLEQQSLLNAIKQRGLKALERAEDKFLNDKQFIYKAYKIQMDSLRYASQDIKNEVEHYKSDRENYIKKINAEIDRLSRKKISSFMSFTDTTAFNETKIKVLKELISFLNESIFDPRANIEKDFFNQKSKSQFTNDVSSDKTNAEILQAHEWQTWDKIVEAVTGDTMKPKSSQ